MNTKTFVISTIALAAVVLAANAQAADGSGTATATVLQPIEITADQTLSFGKFVRGATGGTVVVTTAGVRTATNDVTLSTAGGFESAGTFIVNGEPDATFSITVPDTATLSDGGVESMVINSFADLDGTTATSTAAADLTGGTLTAGTQTIYVGGELVVGAAQAAGDYTGSYNVSVEYN